LDNVWGDCQLKHKKMRHFISSTLILTLISTFTYGQSYTNWITGDKADVDVLEKQSGIVLAGGGGDNDEAMQWMLERADGGDVVVLRASGSDGYNDYFFSELGVSVNSVQTIRFDGPDAATDPYVISTIQNAEALFIAGGDQYDYYEYWKDSPVGDALNYLINEKKITVGGTSAGMAILGQAYYTPENSGIVSSIALENPFSVNMDIIGNGDFLETPYLENLITDTHFEQRDRQGRLLAFMARVANDWEVRPFGIACNEYTAVCIDETGMARVFGEYPQYEDYAFFLQACGDDFLPEIIEPNTPLNWSHDGGAVKVYKLPGTLLGENFFDLTNWTSGSGGEWENWFAIEGQLFQKPGLPAPDCGLLTKLKTPANDNNIRILPTLVSDQTTVFLPENEVARIHILDQNGRVLFEQEEGRAEVTIDCSQWPAGIYFVKVFGKEGVFSKRFIIQ
jgi:cyanophycinase-like exopeptidase